MIINTAICDKGCENGGSCSAPNTCLCMEGYTGHTCGQGTQYTSLHYAISPMGGHCYEFESYMQLLTTLMSLNFGLYNGI